MGTTQTIELNGHVYDARTGKQLHGGTNANISTSAAQVTNIDGFTQPKQRTRKVTATSNGHHGTQKSQTLRRNVVKKPIAVHTKKTSKHFPQEVSRLPETKHASELSRESASRLKRAESTPKSKLIKRFNMDVTASHHVARAKQLPKKIVSTVQAVSHVTEQPVNTFERAIEKAVSHEVKRPKRPRPKHRLAKKLRVSPKLLNAGSLVVAVLLFVGYFGYQNMPNLSMRVASMRSHVGGSLPTYKPTGFSLDRSIQYKPGEIVVGYRSNSDDRFFDIKQSASQWDSEALRQNFVNSQKQVRTISDKGQTIYLYDESNATWVDGGVWYRIEGESLLNSEQLSRLASSL